ncbi:short-subunit dehydrogenase [Rhizomicrobium palustre]|uniref:Short-subunit dehydrogenase n=1 Tax=Rhizomicrobium palustre TaxID=189966 RepID=A0A846MVC9_9PROT|nr:SDR family NAD(P)-dependent oxidoreductase [Rhizomicrobium palustre]NIK87179.1 short-subunit dehydrogenase [Rhizomicrobium palustre]
MERPFAIVTGASSGIGFELAKRCADEGFDLLIAANEPEIEEAARILGEGGRVVQAVEADLATLEGVDKLVDAVRGRRVDALLANAGRGLGHSFLEQNFADVRYVIETNVTGTLYLIHQIGRQMAAKGHGRILITGSIAGFMPGSFQAVYNASKAFLDSFAAALRNELKDSGVSVTCLMPGATDTKFFERAGLTDTKLGTDKKMSPEEVAHQGYEAMMSGDSGVITGLMNKVQVAMTRVMPASVLAEQHRAQTEPGSAEKPSENKVAPL